MGQLQIEKNQSLRSVHQDQKTVFDGQKHVYLSNSKEGTVVAW